MIYDAIIELIGTCPPELENFVYVVACIIFVFLLCSTFTVIGSIFKRISDG